MRKLTFVLGALLLASGLQAQSKSPDQVKDQIKDVTKLKVDDFSFLTGRWRGQLPGGNVAEQICSTVVMQEMMCEFRLNTPKQWVLLEFYTLRQTDHGVELIGVAFDPSLSLDNNATQRAERLVLTPSEFTSEKLVWAGEAGGPVKTSALIFNGNDEMHGHIEHSGGVVDVDWKRIPYDAKLD